MDRNLDLVFTMFLGIHTNYTEYLNWANNTNN